jgi:hypothetical protein
MERGREGGGGGEKGDKKESERDWERTSED